MLSHHTRQIACRFIAILLLACWLSLAAGSLWSPISAQQSPTTAPQQTNTSQQTAELERTKTFPYPPQLIPGQSKCIVLDRHETNSEELTPQEKYARDTWQFPERWIWRQVCAGQEANFYRFYVSALLLKSLGISENLTSKTLPKSDVIDAIIAGIEEHYSDSDKEDFDISKYKQSLQSALNNAFSEDDNENEQSLKDLTFYLEYFPKAERDAIINQQTDAASILSAQHRNSLSIIIGKFLYDQKQNNANKTLLTYLNERLTYLNENLEELDLDGLKDSNPNEFLRKLFSPALIDVEKSVGELVMANIQRADEVEYLTEILKQLNSDNGLESLLKASQEKLDESDIIADSDQAEALLSTEFKKKYQNLMDSLFSNEDIQRDFSVKNNFLKTILLREPFHSALPGIVTIRGGYFTEELNLSSANIKQELRLIDSIFKKPIVLYKSNFAKSLNLDGSRFEEDILLNNSILQGDLFLRDIVFKHNDQPDSSQGPIINLKFLQGQDITLSGKFPVRCIDLAGASIHDLQLKFGDRSRSEMTLNLNNLVAKNVSFSAIHESSLGFQDFFKAGSEVNKSEVNKITTYLGSRLELNVKMQHDILYRWPKPFIKKNIGSVRQSPPEKSQRIKPYLNLSLENAQIDGFEIIPTDKPELKSEPDIDGQCLINLTGFRYQKANSEGFMLLTDCLETKYHETILDDETSSSPESLLQPLEQAAMVARSLGKYDKERDLLYKRKRLEVRIERLQNSWRSPNWTVRSFIWIQV